MRRRACSPTAACAGDDERVVLLNLGDEPRAVELAGEWEVEVATGPGGPSHPAAREGVLLRPARSQSEPA